MHLPQICCPPCRWSCPYPDRCCPDGGPSARRWPSRCRSSRHAWWSRRRWYRTAETPTAVSHQWCHATELTAHARIPAGVRGRGIVVDRWVGFECIERILDTAVCKRHIYGEHYLFVFLIVSDIIKADWFWSIHLPLYVYCTISTITIYQTIILSTFFILCVVVNKSEIILYCSSD